MGAHQSSDAVVDLSVKVEETVKIELPVNHEKQTKSSPQDDEMSSAMAYRTRIMSSEQQQQQQQQHEPEMRENAAVHRPRIYLPDLPAPPEGEGKLSNSPGKAKSPSTSASTNLASMRSARQVLSTVRDFTNTFYYNSRGPEHRDPKKVFDGISALSLHAALDQLSQLKSVIVADKQAVMTRDRDGDRYPLHWAAARGHMHCVQELRRAGADDAGLDANGQTAAELAEAYGAMDVYYFLTYGPAEVDPKPMSGAMMHDALSLHCALNLPRELKRILDKKLGAHANPNRLDKDRDRRPIHWAAARGAIECCRLLLDAGANELCTDKDGRTAADLALVCNQRAAHKLLCDEMVAKQRPSTAKLFGGQPCTHVSTEVSLSDRSVVSDDSKATGEAVVFDRLLDRLLDIEKPPISGVRTRAVETWLFETEIDLALRGGTPPGWLIDTHSGNGEYDASLVA